MRTTYDASGDVLVVTGGASGIGRSLALAAGKAGASVIACDVDPRGLAELEQHGIESIRLDVADRAAVHTAFDAIRNQYGRIDGLACAAAIQPRVAAHEMSPEQWQHVLDVNLNGVLWCYQAVVPDMIRRRRGSIVAFASGLASQGWPGASAYAATKGALVGLVKSAAKEIAPHRVRFNLIAPGVIDTPQYRAANAGADDAAWKATLGVGQPDDVVGPLMFLLSDAATMTGSVLTRDMAFAHEDSA